MAGYGVLALNQQNPCFSNDGLWTNVQQQMKVTFIANFLLHAIQFVVSSAIGPHQHLLRPMKEARGQHGMKFTKSRLPQFMECLLMIALLGAIAFQRTFLTKKPFQPCLTDSQEL